MKKNISSHATIMVAFCDNKYDKRVRNREMEFPEFWRLFKDEPALRRDKNGPGITLGRFDRDAWKAAPGKPIPKNAGGKGTGWLLNEYCLASYGYLGDIDNPGSPCLTFKEACEMLDRLSIAYAAYTTHSSTSDWPKLRFVVPFAEPLKGTPQEIAAGYGAVHDYFNELFKGALDSRRSPAFMAHLPAVHPSRRDDYESIVRRNRALADMTDIIANAEMVESARPLDFPPEAELPRVALGVFQLSEAIEVTILNGPQEDDADRSAACASVYVALHHAGATPAEIAAICWDADFGISERWHEQGRGYAALCLDISRVLGKST